MSTATEVKHTPGPWVAIEGDTFHADRPWGVSRYLSREDHEAIDGEGCEYPTRTETIAEVCGGADPEAVAADARLMAAAPELLEACKRAVKWINERKGNLLDDPDESYAPKFLHSAIEKAEGR